MKNKSTFYAEDYYGVKQLIIKIQQKSTDENQEIRLISCPKLSTFTAQMDKWGLLRILKDYMFIPLKVTAVCV